MKTGSVLAVIFHIAVAVCLWPLYVSANRVVTWIQSTFRLDRTFQFPAGTVIASAVQAALIMWAIGAALVLYRKNQRTTAWLVVLLALVPVLISPR